MCSLVVSLTTCYGVGAPSLIPAFLPGGLAVPVSLQGSQEQARKMLHRVEQPSPRLQALGGDKELQASSSQPCPQYVCPSVLLALGIFFIILL